MEEANQAVSPKVVEDLRRFLVKLSHVGNGLDANLDSELKRLRDLVKEEAIHELLKAQIDKIADLLRELDENDSKDAQSGLDLRVLIRELAKQDLPPEILTKLEKGFSKSHQISELEFSKMLVNIMNGMRDSSSKKKSVFDVFRGKKQSEDSEDKSQAGTIYAKVPSLVQGTLVQLLSNLDLPERFTPQVDQIKGILEQSELGMESLPDLLDKTSRIIIEATSEDHIEFEAFLLDLNNRLGKIQEFIQKTSKSNDLAIQAHNRFNQHLVDEVVNLKANVANTEALDELKNLVGIRLDSVVSVLDEYHITQSSCNETTDNELDSLRTQLQATEKEAQRLKQLLVEQRSIAQSDHLTALPNRHMYLERLDQEYNRWRRYRGNLALVLADIDHFKNINDSYGHLSGDEVIKAIASILRDSIRESDFISRYGGEEFVFLMPETNLTDATKAINKIRQQISQTEIEIPDAKIKVTLSFGVAEFANEDTALDVFGRADKALYRAKEKGRNRVCCEIKPRIESES